jgi:hypothetical protein
MVSLREKPLGEYLDHLKLMASAEYVTIKTLYGLYKNRNLVA